MSLLKPKFPLGLTWELLVEHGWGVRALGVVGHHGGLGRLQVWKEQVELQLQEAQGQHELQVEGVQEELDAAVWGWTWGICAGLQTNHSLSGCFRELAPFDTNLKLFKTSQTNRTNLPQHIMYTV